MLNENPLFIQFLHNFNTEAFFFYILASDFCVARTGINRTFKMTLFVHNGKQLKVIWLILQPCWGTSFMTWITCSSAHLPVKIPFSHSVVVQCAELGDISGPLHSGGGEHRHAYCLPFRNHHFSRIDSTSHSMAGRVRRLYRGQGSAGGGDMCGQLHQGKSTQPRWMIACCVRRFAPHLF